MTLKEIYEIIDEANLYWIKGRNTEKIIVFFSPEQKESVKTYVNHNITNGYTYVFFKLNDNGEIENRWAVDHIDKEKKIVKKKLGEMSDEEIKQVRDKFCKDGFVCHACPFSYSRIDPECLAWFNTWKERIENTKDKEFDVEVEE